MSLGNTRPRTHFLLGGKFIISNMVMTISPARARLLNLLFRAYFGLERYGTAIGWGIQGAGLAYKNRRFIKRVHRRQLSRQRAYRRYRRSKGYFI